MSSNIKEVMGDVQVGTQEAVHGHLKQTNVGGRGVQNQSQVRLAVLPGYFLPIIDTIIVTNTNKRNTK